MEVLPILVMFVGVLVVAAAVVAEFGGGGGPKGIRTSLALAAVGIALLVGGAALLGRG